MGPSTLGPHHSKIWVLEVAHTPCQGEPFVNMHVVHSPTNYKLLHRQLILQGLGSAPNPHNNRYQR